MADMILSVICVVIIVIFYRRYGLKKGKKGTTKGLLLIGTCLFLSIIAVSISLAEQISIHRLPTKGYDFIGFYLENYSVIFITIPMYWITLRLLQKVNNRKAVVLSYSVILFVCWVYSYFVISTPPCEDEGMLCGYTNLRYAAIGIIAFFFIFSVREILLLREDNKEKY
jgi:drug/metabolite transporter (DMT)-like permease